jgi:hypothetical protein
MNLFFAGTALELPLVLGGPFLIISIFYFGKKGKPENYMAHLIRFYLEPGFFAAAEEPVNAIKIRSKVYE